MIDEPHRGLEGRRVLVLEDERLIALDIRDILQGWGCEVLGPVATTDAALALVRSQVPDTAILDVNLNGETSELVADALKDLGRPFLVLTAYQQVHLTGALREAPLLNKPVDEKKLRRALTAVLHESAPR